MARWLPVLALLLAGCGPLGASLGDATTMSYEAPLLRVSADEPTALAAVERHVAEMGWQLDSVDAASARVVAHVDTRDAFTLQRDTWTFQVRPGIVAVRRRLALGDTDGAGLVSSDDVCEDYTYAAERDHLARISALLASAGSQARTARR